MVTEFSMSFHDLPPTTSVQTSCTSSRAPEPPCPQKWQKDNPKGVEMFFSFSDVMMAGHRSVTPTPKTRERGMHCTQDRVPGHGNGDRRRAETSKPFLRP